MAGTSKVLVDMADLPLWSTATIHLREHAYVVVEGTDEMNAFLRGMNGFGLPLNDHLPRTVLFDRLYPRLHPYTDTQIGQRNWVAEFLSSCKGGWEQADDVGIVVRWAAAMQDPSARLKFSGWDAAFYDGIRGAKQKSLLGLITASLTDPGESLVEDAHFGPYDMGDEPAFTAVCVRAVAIMHMGEGPQKDKAAVLELPKSLESNFRRFLFFGLKDVV